MFEGVWQAVSSEIVLDNLIDTLVALHRGSEVILGAIVGWIIHWLVQVVVDAFVKRRHASETNSENGRP
jgi:hypothetical protein